MPEHNDLRRRNGLWQQLRSAAPFTPEFEAILTQLSTLTGWNRARVLAALDLPPQEPSL